MKGACRKDKLARHCWTSQQWHPCANQPFPEVAWAGKRVRLGDAVLRMTLACPRCVMTTLPFDDLPKDPGVMRALVKEADGNFGVCATIEQPGTVRVGDAVEVMG